MTAAASYTAEQRDMLLEWMAALLKTYRPTLETFHGESDRGAVLVVGAQLDEALADVLRTAMVPDHDKRLFSRALRSTAVKIELAYGLGLIGKLTRDRLDAIRDIRNACAHSSETFAFEDPDIRSRIGQMGDVDFFIPREIRAGTPREVARGRFLGHALFLLLALTSVSGEAPKAPRAELWLASVLMDMRSQEMRAELEAQLEAQQRDFAAREKAHEERIAELEREMNLAVETFAAAEGISLEDAWKMVHALEETTTPQQR